MIEKIYARPVGYELIEFLGEGLNSCVYRAIKEDTQFGVRFEVALKILKSEKLVALWRAEFERLSVVKSNNCVGLLGWEFIYNKPALVLEYVKGVTLEDLCQSGRLKAGHLIEIVAQAMQGLSDLKRAHLFHGDLNLHNIMINEDGVVKLVDFGVVVSRVQIMTTLQFASPEVINGDSPSYSTDVYSLRAIALEICRRLQIRISLKIDKLRSFDDQQSDLASLVAQVREEKIKLQGKTQSLAQIQKQEWGMGRILSHVLCLTLYFISFVSRGDGVRHEPVQYGKISARTKEWVHIKLNGEDKGYAPLDFWSETRARVVLQWEGAAGAGQTSLTLKEGQHIVLDDNFFRNNAGKQ